MHRLKLTFKVLFLIFTTLVFSGCNVSEKEKSKIVGQNANAPIQTNFYIYNNNPTGVNESNRATFPISGVCSEPGNPIDINYGPLIQTTTCRTDKTWLLSLDLTLVNDGTITFHAKEYRLTDLDRLIVIWPSKTVLIL